MNISDNATAAGIEFDGPFYEFFDHLLAGCQIIGSDGRYLYVNNAAARQGRRDKADLLGRTMEEAYPGIENTEVYRLVMECMADRMPHRIENQFGYDDGSSSWFDLSIERVSCGVFVFTVDITQLKRAEAKVEHLKAVLLGLRRVNQLITRERDPLRLVQKACDLLVEARGFSVVSIVLTGNNGGGDGSAKYGVAGEVGPELRKMLEGGIVPECSRRAMADGRVVEKRELDPFCESCPVAAEELVGDNSLSVGLELEGTVYGFMLVRLPSEIDDDMEEMGLLLEIAGDIAYALRSIGVESERDESVEVLARTEEQLRQSQKLEAVGQLAGGVAHDFNNILMAQMGYCDLMQMELRKDDPLAADLAEVKACAERAASLTRQLLAFSRRQTMHPEILNLNEIVRAIEKMLKRLIGENIDYSSLLADDLGSVLADPGQLDQVIMNIVVNARDAMPQGGELRIETASVELDDEYASQHLDATAGPHVMLAVSDTGGGMDEKTRERIFEPFFTTKGLGQGSGLGLSTVYGIVKQSGGNVWVYSEPGQGTTVKIYLPCVQGFPVRQDGRTAEESEGRGELVLVVEDEPSLRNVLPRIIKSLGYRVRIAADGEEALAVIEVEGLRPDILLTDVVLPGMGGRALAERLCRLQPALKVLYMSGYTDNSIVHHGVLEPGIPFIQKPFSNVDLAAKLRDVLDR